jgi:hypothetical protein
MLSFGCTTGIAALLTWLAADPPAMYLPPAQTGGSEYQFDPDSPALRKAIKARNQRADDVLDARALAEDLVFLRRALRQIYIGYPELLQSHDFDVEARFDQEIARLRAGPAQVKFGDTVLPLFKEIKRHINDNHLAMSGWDHEVKDEYREYQASVSAPPSALEKCTVPQASPTTVRLAPVVSADGKRGQVVTVSARGQGDALELACGDQRLTLTGRPPAPGEQGAREKPPYEWRRAGDATIIRIRRFYGPPAALANLEQLAKDYPAHRRAPIIVFDLRGNGGGNDAYTYRWISEAKRGPWGEGSFSLYPSGANRPWVMWNQEVWAAISQNRVDDPASVAKRNELRAQWPRSPSELSLTIKIDDHDDKAKMPYQGRVFVLMDRSCGSSGESSAWALRAALGATLVGERTAGFLEYGNQRQLALPRTALRFFFATKRNYFRTPLEAVGLPADVYLAPELLGKTVEELLPVLKKLPR